MIYIYLLYELPLLYGYKGCILLSIGKVKFRVQTCTTVQIHVHMYICYCSNPPIDLKYLQKRDDAIPVRGLINHSSSPPRLDSPITTPPITNTVVSNRLPQQLIIPKTSTPPLASAYFGQLKPST